jgi:zinc-ribbon domain
LSNETPNQNEIQRELSVSETFGRSFDLARRNYLKLLPIFAVFGIVAALLGALVSNFSPSLSSVVLPQNVSSMTQAQAAAVLGFFGRYLLYLFANIFVTTIVLYFAVGIGVWQLLSIVGQKQNLGLVLSNRINYVNIALTTIIAVAIIEISGVVLVGPLIFCPLFYLCYTASAEGKSVFGALGRSRELISGKFGKTFLVFAGIQIMIWIGAALVSQIVSIFVFSDAIISAVQNFILGLELPLVSASMVVLYLSFKRGREVLSQRPPSLYDSMRPQPMPGFARTNFCSACGTSVSQDEKFCHNCGAALSTQR